MARRILWASLVLVPVALAARFLFHAGATPLFVLAAAALVPLAWLIGESTEHAAEHTGPGVGGFLNASFGNAPELIIALFAVADGLPNVVRGSLTGSVVSNILLVLGVALVLGKDESPLDPKSLRAHLGLVLLTAVILLVPSVPGWHGSPERHSLAVVTAPVALLLLVVYGWQTWWSLRRHRQQHAASGHEASPEGWSLPAALGALAAATLLTALVSEILVHSLDRFARAAGLSQFLVSAVIVAIVGNAAEHGGAIVIATRGKMRLATEIAISSSAQVAVFVIPAVALLSWLVTPALPLAFRPVELATIGSAAVLGWVVTRDGRSRRWEGFLLVGAYALVVAAYALAGDR